jgi:hypothetical protein
MDIETIRAEIRESQARCNHRLIKIVSSRYRYKCIKCQKKLKIASGVMVVDRKPLLKG